VKDTMTLKKKKKKKEEEEGCSSGQHLDKYFQEDFLFRRMKLSYRVHDYIHFG
jgi:hypothetical protein